MFSTTPSTETQAVPSAPYDAVRITDNAMRNIREEAGNWSDVETGGALVGYVEERVLVVTHASDPGPRGERRRESVSIDGEYTADFAYRLHQESRGRLEYVGDWHTHITSGELALSSRDRKAMRRLLEAKASPLEYLISLLLSASLDAVCGFGFGLGAYAKSVPVLLGGQAEQ